jgi:hypothetical protein
LETDALPAELRAYERETMMRRRLSVLLHTRQ